MTSEQVDPASRFSAAAAASLSFLFPGLGQGYLRQARAALIFAAPAIALVVALGVYVADGLTLAALRLLDPTVALLATVLIVQLGFWRAFSVMHAWRTGRRTRAGAVVIPLLIAAITLSHGVGAWYTLSFMQAGERIFTTDAALDSEQWPDEDEVFRPPPSGPDDSPPPNDDPTDQPAVEPTDGPRDPTDQPAVEPTDGPRDPHAPDDGEPSVEPGPTPPNIDPDELDGSDDVWTNVLIVGMDWTASRTHALTDTMIVVSVNTSQDDVYMFSFPRDVAEFPLFHGGRYMGRLNTFANYAHRHPELYPGGGMHALSRQIGFLLGVPIDHYAAINIPGFEFVLDAVGPVTVYNHYPINDPRRNFYLAVGEHRLDTEATMHFVRSRYGPGNNDFRRAARQQEVLSALRDEILRADRVADLPRIIDGVSRVLSTNYPPGRIDEALRMAELVGRRPKDSWVFGSPAWAVHPPLSETGGRWVIRLRTDKIADLSRQIYGSASLYSR